MGINILGNVGIFLLPSYWLGGPMNLIALETDDVARRISIETRLKVLLHQLGALHDIANHDWAEELMGLISYLTKTIHTAAACSVNDAR